jgi:signal peptidase I
MNRLNVVFCMNKTVAVFVIAFLLGAVSCSGQKAFTMPNSSMEPTVRKGEKFSVYDGAVRASRGDLIVFEHEGLTLIKRVIAVGGDTIEGRNNEVFLNGSAIKEPYIQHVGPPNSPLSKFGPVKVGAGQVFVAGDNRDYSLDSRTASFGVIPTTDIKGTPTEIVDSGDRTRVHTRLSGGSVR